MYRTSSYEYILTSDASHNDDVINREEGRVLETVQKPARKPCVIANWKMHGSHQKNLDWLETFHNLLEIANLSALAAGVEIVICPPHPYLEQVHALIQTTFLKTKLSLKLGAQNVYCEAQGAYTGEVSPAMLVDLGCQYVIIGHSERREQFGETDNLIARKFRAAYDAGLIPILCVGETLSERKSGQTMERVEGQIKAILENVPPSALQRALIAYEPVWAIGTGLSAAPLEAQTVQARIRGLLSQVSSQISEQVGILYGGSVKGESAAALFSQPDIDGGLIGGASLSPQEFLQICQAAIFE